MKMILAMIVALCAFSAFAADFECTKQVSATRTEGARISAWPHLMVGTSFSECTSGGGVGQCSTGSLEEIVSPYSVCYKKVDADHDCKINETASSVEVVCANGSTMKFVMGADSAGQITCSENGVVRKTWNVGTCTIK